MLNIEKQCDVLYGCSDSNDDKPFSSYPFLTLNHLNNSLITQKLPSHIFSFLQIEKIDS